MKIIQDIRDRFGNYTELNNTFVGTPPYPMIVLDDFLPKEFALKFEEECNTVPDQHWTEFTRRGSYMKECKKLEHAPVAFDFVNQLHSSLGMEWLTKVTGIKDLIPDPYLTGAGYSRSYTGNSLKMHTDFNWNDQLRLHRMCSFIVYLNSNWKEEYGGALQFNDFNNENTVQKIPTIFNRAVIWRNHKRGFHGFPDPLQSPEGLSRNTFRLFFYISDAQPREDDRPHRSLYWFDNELGEPYDIPTHK
jgi:hypothetical protein